ncbi:MAG: hypothetical protein O7G88_02825 [bacterium]|nr:hypothetical protein [bacterium]
MQVFDLKDKRPLLIMMQQQSMQRSKCTRPDHTRVKLGELGRMRLQTQ